MTVNGNKNWQSRLAPPTSKMADFTSKEYTSDDFRKEEHLFSRFYSDEISSAPGITWCTEYFYRRMPEGRYRLVTIDYLDNELYCHNEYDSAQAFADDFRAGYQEEEDLEDEDLLKTILSLCPEDIRSHVDELKMLFCDRTASLLESALEDGDRSLVKALLPDFAAFRERLYPSPHIPCISAKERKRRRDMIREYYRSQKRYEEVRPYVFSETDGRSYRHSVGIGENEIGFSYVCRVGGDHSQVSLEDTENLRKMYPDLDFGSERG